MPAWDVIHGEALDVLRETPDEFFGAAITDPPYSSGGQYRGDRVASTTVKYTRTAVQCGGWVWRGVAPWRKPNVLREIVKITPAGALIVDPFCGSGTTGLAALLEGRRFLGIDSSAHYAQVARERVAAGLSE